MPKKEDTLAAVVRADAALTNVDGTPRIDISPEEKAVLKKILDRNRTSMAVHGGLKSLFVLTDDETTVLLGFLERV